jgi:hypothetical protein
MLWILLSREWGLQLLGLHRFNGEDLALRRLGLLFLWLVCLRSRLLILTRRRCMLLRQSRDCEQLILLWRLSLMQQLLLVCTRMICEWRSMQYLLVLGCLLGLLWTALARTCQPEDGCVLSPVLLLRRRDGLRLPRLHARVRLPERMRLLVRVRERRQLLLLQLLVGALHRPRPYNQHLLRAGPMGLFWPGRPALCPLVLR